MVSSSAKLHDPEEGSAANFPDIDNLKIAFGQLPSGVVIVTSQGCGGEMVGATVSSFTSLSFTPPLVMLGLAQSSTTLSAILDHGHFAVHVVAEPQQDIAMRFASSRADKFSDIDFKLSPSGVPILSEFDTCFHCALERAQSEGDHQLLIGRIVDVSTVERDTTPVAWFNRRFHICEPRPAA
ncbi:flavin reductase family protein [Agrobacterium vitis]|uniref:flavin reductase family protein n=1 Tax=Allorhizobium ampelinum TaxID=3025782 RepID=UPI001F38F45D|nr:flavin reductase family protein [Allorhizobium ampelinum]MCF1460634.1 flavin reductase family protein [Allorhizobium ampelinum]